MHINEYNKGNINNQDTYFRGEKLSPVSIIYTYGDFSEEIKIAKENLNVDGKGHSVAIHSHTDEHIKEFAHAVYVSRVIVNQPSNFNAGGDSE